MSVVIRALLVEDTDPKRSRVVELLRAHLNEIRCDFEFAADYDTAVRLLREQTYDLVIMDLLIPLANKAPSLENSEALISLMMSGTLAPATHIIGLTEFPNAATEASRLYAENLLSLEVFTWNNDGWAKRIAAKISYLMKSKLASIQFGNMNFESDLLLLVARYENEFKPILERMKWRERPEKRSLYFPGYEFAGGTLCVGKDLDLRTQFFCIGEMGMAPAAVLATQAISIYRPRIVAMAGMCCGFATERCASPSKFGDVLIARESASWEEGKYSESDDGEEGFFRNRTQIRSIDDSLRTPVQMAVEASRDNIMPLCSRYLKGAKVRALRGRLGDKMREEPDFKLGLIVSGSSIIASEQQVLEIIDRNPAAIGLDMELFGIYTAAQKRLGKKPSVIGVKGVADFGTVAKDDQAQSHASILSLLTLFGVLRRAYSEGHVHKV